MKQLRARWIVAALLAVGVALRIAWQVPLHRYPGDGDCSVIGFGAWEVLAGDPRVFVSTGYRQGALACYLAAGASWLVGPGRAALALEVAAVGILQMFVWWKALLELTGWKSRQAESALLLPFVVLPAPAVVYWGIYLPNGYPELFLSATLVLLAGARLWRRSGRREVFAFGLACGFAFWMSMLTLTIILPVLGWIAWQRRREVLSLSSAVLSTSGAALGALPWLAFNIHYGWVSLKANWASRPASGWTAVVENARRLIFDVVPTFFAAAGQASPMPELTIVQRAFGWAALAFAGVLLAALGSAAGRWQREGGARSESRKRFTALVGLAAAVMAATAILFVFSAAASAPGNISRYLLSSFLVFPLLVALAWEVGGVLARRSLTFLALVLLAGYAAALPLPWTPARTAARLELDGVHQILGRLEAEGIQVVFGSFWEVYPLVFESGGALGGSTLEPELDFHRLTAHLPKDSCRWALVTMSKWDWKTAVRAGFVGKATQYPGGRWLYLPEATADPARSAQGCREILDALRAHYRR